MQCLVGSDLPQRGKEGMGDNPVGVVTPSVSLSLSVCVGECECGCVWVWVGGEGGKNCRLCFLPAKWRSKER